MSVVPLPLSGSTPFFLISGFTPFLSSFDRPRPAPALACRLAGIHPSLSFFFPPVFVLICLFSRFQEVLSRSISPPHLCFSLRVVASYALFFSSLIPSAYVSLIRPCPTPFLPPLLSLLQTSDFCFRPHYMVGSP